MGVFPYTAMLRRMRTLKAQRGTDALAARLGYAHGPHARQPTARFGGERRNRLCLGFRKARIAEVLARGATISLTLRPP